MLTYLFFVLFFPVMRTYTHNVFSRFVPVVVVVVRNEQREMLRRMCRKPDDEPEPLYTIRQVARHLHCDESTVRRWINEGVLKSVILSHPSGRRSYRIKKSIIDSLLNDPPSA